MNMYIIRRRPKIEFCGSHFGYSMVMFVCCCCCCCCFCCCCCCYCLRMFQYMWYFYTSCWKAIFANIKKYWKSTDSVLGFVVLGGKILQNVKLYDSNFFVILLPFWYINRVNVKFKELHLSAMATILDVISGLINAIISNSKASYWKHCKHTQSLISIASKLNFRVLIGEFCPILNKLCTSHFGILVAILSSFAFCTCIIILCINIYYYKHYNNIQPVKTTSFQVKFVLFKLCGNHFEFVRCHFVFSLIRQVLKFQI